MDITITGWIVIPILILCAYKLKLTDLILVTAFTSIFTSTAVIYLSKIDLYIGVQQFAGAIFILRFLYELIITKKINLIKINKILLIFIIYAFASIFIPLVMDKTDNLVIGVSSHMEFSPVKFSLSNITQFIYLLLGFLIYVVSYISLVNNGKELDEFLKKFKITILASAVVMGILGILQIFIKTEIFNLIFRHYNYSNQMTTIFGININRPSGPTGEPSFYSLILVPMLCYITYNYKFYISLINKKYYIVSIIVIIIPLLISKSSSFIIGIMIFILLLLLLNYIKLKQIYIEIKYYLNILNKRKKVMIYMIVIAISSIFIIFLLNSQILREFIYKIQGQGTSGSERITALRQHLNVFKNNILFGVGFGSLRSKDLISTWLAAMGIVGNTLFFIFLIRQIYKLYKINSSDSLSIGIIVSITWIILFISVPEPYYLCIWIYFAIAEYLIVKNKV